MFFQIDQIFYKDSTYPRYGQQKDEVPPSTSTKYGSPKIGLPKQNDFCVDSEMPSPPGKNITNGVQKVEFERIWVSFQAFSAVMIQETIVLLHLKYFEFREHVHTFNGTKRPNYVNFSTLKLALLVGKRFLLHTRKKVSPVPRTHFHC